MKKDLIVFFMIAGNICYAHNPMARQSGNPDNQYINLNMENEKILYHDGDTSGLPRFKASGYLQAQFETFTHHESESMGAENTFYIRRARVKFAWKAIDGLRFVVQPDFRTGKFCLNDAYARVVVPGVNALSISLGQFCRPNYEVEYSSAEREVLERSRIITTIYPGEHEVGAKLEFIPDRVPLAFQFAVVNGNYTGSELKDVDSRKDLMARAVYSFAIAEGTVNFNVGAHCYYGSLMSQIKYISDYNATLDSSASNSGKYLDKKWGGLEMQAFFDLLGGVTFKGEYIAGKNALMGTSKTDPYKTRQFNGFYLYLIKKISEKNRFSARYDYFDPNSRLSAGRAGKDIAYKTFVFAWQYAMNDNIMFTFNYEVPENETNDIYPDNIRDNSFAIRMQAKF